KDGDEATKVGSESDVLDFVEERVNSSLAELATRADDDPASTVDGTKPSGPTSSRTSWASHPWEDDEHWDDYQNYLDHNS
ncbi:unnamed protein product, partial [Ectocarpus fasciculatus]